MLRSSKRKSIFLLTQCDSNLCLLCNRRKTAAASAGGGAAAQTAEEAALQAPEYKKIYKQLGANSGCKDVRNVIQGRLDSTTEAPMSPNFQLNMNPGYQLDNGMNRTTVRETLKGEKT